MMARARALILFAALCCAATSAQAQSSTKETKDGTASISGRITIGDEPAPGVIVRITREENMLRTQTVPPSKATTDEDGRYRLTGLAAGQYVITLADPTLLVPANSNSWRGGKSVYIAEGEEVEGIDFVLMRGGVITGRVTDDRGRPLIEEQVMLNQVDKNNRKLPGHISNYSSFTTDDRGVYRIYGILPGHYAVSVGKDINRNDVRIGEGGDVYVRTFHPDVTDSSQAKIIEISSGEEVTGVNITVGRASKTYHATGRVVYADNGEPVTNARYGYGTVSADGQRMGNAGYGYRTDAQGNMRLEGILPGRYVAFSAIESESDYYSELVPFEITDADVSGLEIKVHRGASISGVAVIEGTNDPAVLTRISQLHLGVYELESRPSAPRQGRMDVGPDGSFRINGLRPGRVKFAFAAYNSVNKGFHLLRVERDGVDLSEGIEVSPGETISGVRFVLGYGSGRIRGQIKVAEGSIPAGIRFIVSARRLSDADGQSPPGMYADERGRFLIEGLMAGEYELLVRPISTPAAAVIISPKNTVKQTVSVADQLESDVTITIDLSARNK